MRSQRRQPDPCDRALLRNAATRAGESIVIETDVEYLDDWIDDYGPAVWVNATSLNELDDSSFFHWVETIVERE